LFQLFSACCFDEPMSQPEEVVFLAKAPEPSTEAFGRWVLTRCVLRTFDLWNRLQPFESNLDFSVSSFCCPMRHPREGGCLTKAAGGSTEDCGLGSDFVLVWTSGSRRKCYHRSSHPFLCCPMRRFQYEIWHSFVAGRWRPTLFSFRAKVLLARLVPFRLLFSFRVCRSDWRSEQRRYGLLQSVSAAFPSDWQSERGRCRLPPQHLKHEKSVSCLFQCSGCVIVAGFSAHSSAAAAGASAAAPALQFREELHL
jgi:hypothetical protein